MAILAGRKYGAMVGITPTHTGPATVDCFSATSCLAALISLENGTGPGKKPLAKIGEPHRSPQTIKEAHAQFFLFHAARQGNKHVTVNLINGVRLSGRVRSFDKHSVVLETATLEQLVFKHSISAAFICVNKHCTECYPGQISPALRP